MLVPECRIHAGPFGREVTKLRAEVKRLRAALRLCEHVLHRAEPTDAQIHAAQQASGAYDTDWTVADVEDDLVPGSVLGNAEIDWADVDWADELDRGDNR